MSMCRTWPIARRMMAVGLVGASLLLANGGKALAQTHPEQAIFKTWLQYLHNTAGYSVTQGDASPFQGCVTYIANFGTCFGNNPSTPYFVLNVPVGGSTLPTYMSAFSSTGSPPAGAASNTFYQLGKDEAVVTIITLPPRAAYFGTQTYMVERDAHRYDPLNVPPVPTPPAHCNPGTAFYTGTAPNLVRHSETSDCQYNVFGYINNAINNIGILHEASIEFSGIPSCTTQCAVAIVTTPNQALYDYIVTTVFSGIEGNNPLLVFEEGMATNGPSPLLNIDPTSYLPDTFASIMRYEIPSDGGGAGTPSDTWKSAIASNVLVFRIKQPPGTVTGISTPVIKTQSCNTNETAFVPTTPPALCATGSTITAHLATLTTLLQTWLVNHTSETYYLQTASSPPPSSGYNCLTTGISCAGPTLDNNAYRSVSPGPLTTSGPIFVIGVLHSASAADNTTSIPTNNASYTGIGLADNAGGINEGLIDQNGTNVSGTSFAAGFLPGSASAILHDLAMTPSDTSFVNDLPNFYVTVFNRSGTCILPGASMSGCSKNYVVNIGSALPSTDPVKITERGYLLPPPSSGAVLETGANPNYLASPNILCDSAGGAACGP